MSRLVTQDTIQQIMTELGHAGLMVTRVRWPDQQIPDPDMYQPFARGWATFAPWRNHPHIEAMRKQVREHGVLTLVDDDRAWTLINAFQHTRSLEGEVWETGVYQGGSASLLKLLIEEARAMTGKNSTILRLFDSFEGLPHSDHELDLHHAGDFNDTGLEQVMQTVGTEDWIDFRKGWIPETFAGLEDARIRFAHIDVDLYQPILDSCEFIYPRLAPGAVMVFDDYGFPSCPGARAAIDEFFKDKPESPFILINGQCIAVRHCCAK